MPRPVPERQQMRQGFALGTIELLAMGARQIVAAMGA